MFDIAIYSKTDKGREEVAHRSHGLSQRLRKALIMVDGKTCFGDLRPALALLGDPKAIVWELSAMGFVESNYDLPPMPVFNASREDFSPTLTPTPRGDAGTV